MSLKSKIQALITAANAKTGETDATLTDAVQTLVDGYGGITPSGSVTLTSENTYDVTDKASAIVDFSATRANLAEAVTAKGVDTLPTSSFDTIATNIGLITGGGGGLPSSINKLDGGSFTPASDTDVRDYAISHNLGEKPKGFVIWSDDLAYGTAESDIMVVNAMYKTVAYSATAVSSYLLTRKTTAGTFGQYTNTVAATAESNWLTSTIFKIGISSYYKAGCTYKWIAWA